MKIKQSKTRYLVTMVCMIMIMVTGCAQDKTQSSRLGTKVEGKTLDLVANSLDEWMGYVEEEPMSLAPTRETYEPVDILNNKSDKIIEMKEDMFVAQSNDIFINSEDYIGKTIKLEGIFQEDYLEETNTIYYSVIRYGPGCCETDVNVGLEVRGDMKYPAENEWVEAVGILELYEEDGISYLRLNLTSLTVLAKRGEEYVYQ